MADVTRQNDLSLDSYDIATTNLKCDATKQIKVFATLHQQTITPISLSTNTQKQTQTHYKKRHIDNISQTHKHIHLPTHVTAHDYPTNTDTHTCPTHRDANTLVLFTLVATKVSFN